VAGPKSWAVTAGKLVQATLKAQLFQQLSCEIQELRDKGKIPAHQNSCGHLFEKHSHFPRSPWLIRERYAINLFH